MCKIPGHATQASAGQVYLGFGLSASVQVPDKPALAWVACPGILHRSQVVFMCCGKGNLAFTSSHRYGQILLIF